MGLCLLAESFSTNLSYLGSSYFGGFLLTVNVATGLGLALSFHAVGVMAPILREFIPAKFPDAWILGLSWGAMSLLGTFAFASMNQAFATTNPVRFAICAISAASAGYFSWEAKASRERERVAESFRKSKIGLRSLRSYLLTWVSAVSLAIFCANLAFLPSYFEYHGVLWFLLTLLNIVFCISLGLVTGYVLFTLNWFTVQNYVSDGELRGNKRMLFGSRILQVFGGGAVLAYLLAPAMPGLTAAVTLGLVISGSVWFVTFKSLKARSSEN